MVYDENEWIENNTKESLDPAREINGCKGGCGHPTREITETADALFLLGGLLIAALAFLCALRIALG